MLFGRQPQRMRIAKLAFLVPLAAQVLLLGGCTTSAVWQAGQFARYHDPASPPDLCLFYSSIGNDFLVEYTEIRENDGMTTQRAYWLEREAGRKKPRFISGPQIHGLEPVLVFSSPPSANLRPAESPYAVSSTNNLSFTLYRAGKSLGTYDLPDYADSTGRLKQVLLTPPAVLADVTIVGGVVAWFSLPIVWQALACANR